MPGVSQQRRVVTLLLQVVREEVLIRANPEEVLWVKAAAWNMDCYFISPSLSLSVFIMHMLQSLVFKVVLAPLYNSFDRRLGNA